MLIRDTGSATDGSHGGAVFGQRDGPWKCRNRLLTESRSYSSLSQSRDEPATYGCWIHLWFGSKPRFQKGGDHLPHIIVVRYILTNAMHDFGQQLVLGNMIRWPIRVRLSMLIGQGHEQSVKDDVKQQLYHQPSSTQYYQQWLCC